jgi:hypothetical protein
MNNPIYVHFYSNGLYLYTKQLDTRIALSDLRTYLSMSQTIQFLHEALPIETYSESELQIKDVLQSKTEVYLRDTTTQDLTDYKSELLETKSTKPVASNILNKEHVNLKRRGRKIKIEDKKFKQCNMKELISPTIISNWYKSTDYRIKKVNFEIERKRFTSLIFNTDKTTKKISLNVASIMGVISLEDFIKYCLPIIEEFFENYFEDSITRYLKLEDGKYII